MSQDNLAKLYSKNLRLLVSKLPSGLAQFILLSAAYVYITSPLFVVLSLVYFGYIPEDAGWDMGVILIAGVVLSYIFVIIPLGMAMDDKWGS